MADPVVEISDLWTRFGSTVVHRGIDLEVRRDGQTLNVPPGQLARATRP